MATLRLAPGAQPEFVALPASDYPRWSPDGSSILYHVPEGFRLRRLDGSSDILLVSAADSGGDMLHAAYSPDGSTLFVLTRTPQGWAIRSVPSAGGSSKLRVVFDEPTMQHAKFGLATDGKLLYFTIGAPASDVWVADLVTP
jgi:Tol biopolymer transport system component